ncbi:Rho GTPase activation protein, partial [Rhizodiscina lignyota]
QNRPRTRTLEERNRETSPSSFLRKARNRMGSVGSTASSAYHGSEETVTSIGHPSTIPSSMPPPSSATSLRSTKSNRNRIVKQQPQRSTSPVSSTASQIDLPPRAIPTANARRIFHLMRSTCGRMEGMLAFRRGETSPWALAYCIINDESGSLVYEPKSDASYYRTLVSDLRSCQVRTALDPESHHPYLDVSPHSSNLEIHLRPHSQDEYESWFAALLCWQPIQPKGIMNRMAKSQVGMAIERRLVDSRRHSEVSLLKEAPIIKVGKMIFWDTVVTSEIGFRSTGRSAGSRSMRRWRRVSCTLRENGEMKLYSENDVSLVSVVQLAQLSRCAIQRLDASVLDTDFCLAIYPQYTSSPGNQTNVRPIFLSMETRVLYEVWLVLLRAFTLPQLYGPKQSFNPQEEQQPYATPGSDMFRMERSIWMRVLQAKMTPPLSPSTGVEMTLPRHPNDRTTYSGGFYTEILLDGETRGKTIPLKEALTPFWREDFDFLDLPAGLSIMSMRLKERPDDAPPPKERSLREEVRRMYDSTAASTGTSSSSSGSSTDQTVGQCDIYLDDLESSREVEKWWPLINKYGQNVGEVQLAIRAEEAVILMARDYQPLSELLHRFSNGLTLQIAQVLSGQLTKLSEHLLNIFQVSGKASEWLMALVEEEIDSAGGGKEAPKINSVNRLRFSKRMGSSSGGPRHDGSSSGASGLDINILDSPEGGGGGSSSRHNIDRELFVRDMGKNAALEANLLFRANTLCTKSLDLHMRRLGREYLDNTLGDKMKEITDKDPDCEVDPNRVESQPELERNWRRLLGWTSEIWKTIYASINQCPPELRLIFRHVMACAEDRYGDFLRTVRYSSVSGFLFLRFFCPAVLGPKLFGLLKGTALTFIAKILMALANVSTFGIKEPWMEPANSFLQSHRQQFKDFVDNICSIPSSTATAITAIQPSYSTPLAILQRLPPGSREGFPSLPYLIDHARSFAELVELWLENTKNITSTMQGSEGNGDLLRFHNICAALRKRTQDVLARAERAERPGSALEAKWEAVVDEL